MAASNDEPTTPGDGQRQAARRTALVLTLAVVGISLGVVALVLASSGGSDVDRPAAPPGTQEYTVRSAGHVEGSVDYEQDPPVGGDHAAVWQNCGFYDEPIRVEQGVHSLEHGAVWITYDPGLDDADLAAVRRLAEEPYVLASPWSTSPLPAPIVLSAWGVQLATDDVSSDAVLEFVSTYRQAASAPEPGAPCTGGDGGTMEA